jgi:hypothetical protein
MTTFETRDLYFACFLRSLGYKLADVRWEGRRATFVFADRPERRATTLAFYNNQGVVRPLSFVNAIKEMKALIHNT